MMKKTWLGRILRYCAIRIFVDGLWFVILFSPFIAWYLWRFWWTRPIIIWYTPLLIVMLFTYTCFPMTAVFCLLRNGGKSSTLRPLLMRFQLFTSYLFLRFLHGSEIHGIQNLPKGGGLVVYYHAPCLPVDMAYLFSYIYLKFGRMLGGSMDKNWHRNWFFRPIVELYEYTSDRQQFIDDLKNGKLRSVAPGGAYEAMFSKNYSLEWRCRTGFAKIAKETGVPVVPMFTRNLQHSMPLSEFNRSDTMKEWYSLIKRPSCLPKYYLPVKLRTYLGEPLVCGEDEEPDAFAHRVKQAIEKLRDEHQPRHQTSWDALRERLW